MAWLSAYGNYIIDMIIEMRDVVFFILNGKNVANFRIILHILHLIIYKYIFQTVKLNSSLDLFCLWLLHYTEMKKIT